MNILKAVIRGITRGLFGRGFEAFRVIRRIERVLDRALNYTEAREVRTFQRESDTRGYLLTHPLSEVIPENLVTEVGTEMFKPDYNFYVRALINKQDVYTGEVRQQWVSWYTDQLDSPENMFNEFTEIFYSKFSYAPRYDVELLSIDTVWHKEGWPYEKYY